VSECNVVQEKIYKETLTCRTHLKKIVREPFMDDANWADKRLEFIFDHPPRGGQPRTIG
jgi:hypothetical protein